MTITLGILGILILIYFSAKTYQKLQFQKEVKTLFALAAPIRPQRFHNSQLIDLPIPVQKYFKYVLKNNQPYISYARIKHDGQFKTGFDKDWTDIEGEQYFTTLIPGFVWKGTTSFFTARDMYLNSKGKLVVTLFSLITIMDKEGEAFNQGELLRWLSEGIWFPTNLLPSDRLKWEAIDDSTSRLKFEYKELSLFYIVSFNAIGEIIQVQTKRYMSENKLETWVAKISDYKEMNEVKIPTSIEVLWRLEKGDFSYAKFHLKTIEYDIPKMF